MSLTINPFFWRHATINHDVTYQLNTNIAPLSIMNGQITNWVNETNLNSLHISYKSINIPYEERNRYYLKNEIDNNGLYWVCVEEQAKQFLSDNYPEIHNKYLEAWICFYESQNN